MALSPSVADLLPAARIAWCNHAWPWPGGPKSTGYPENSEEPDADRARRRKRIAFKNAADRLEHGGKR